MKMNFQALIDRKRQQGAALIIGLLLLVVITILAVSGMNTATTELAMARNDQSYENAFQSAETGLETALAQGNWNTAINIVVTPPPTSAYEVVTATVQFEDSTLVPDQAFSLGSGSGITAFHFIATSQAEYRMDPGNVTDRDASATHTQAFYVVGPDSPTL
jgi:type IV pilus assembly protein PilX